MKKCRLFVITALLIGALFGMGACGEEKGLSAPTQFDINEEHQLTWDAVEAARNYAIEIKSVATNESKEVTSRRSTTSLADLAEGDYEIRIKALGNGKTVEDSDWSKTIFFHKKYETGCIYTLINGNTAYQLSKYGEAAGDVNIEGTYRGKPVLEIAPRAFKGCTAIENVIIGDNITKIGDNAFYNCKNLKSVTISETVTYLGEAVFQTCGNLESVNIPKSVTQIGDYTFAYCRSLKDIELHDGITSIGEYAFSDCSSLTEMVLPDGLTSLGNSAFTGNLALQSLTIGSGLTQISESAFYMCKALETVEFSENSALTVIGANAFGDCVSLSSIVLPEGIVELKNSAFCMRGENVTDDAGNETVVFNSKLQTVELPSTLKKVGQKAFFGTGFYMEALLANEPYIYADDWLIACSMEVRTTVESIEADTWKETVVGIAEGVFQGCEKLQTLRLPYGVKYIGTAAFYNNPKLFSIDLSPKMSEDGETVEGGVLEIGDYAFAYCSILRDVKLGVKQYQEDKEISVGSVERIGQNAFLGCSRLNNSEKNVLTPNSLTSIGKGAFQDTAMWKEPQSGIVYAGNWIVGYNASEGQVTSVDVKNADVMGIADYAFANCKTMSSFILPDDSKLRYIGKGAFYRCVRLDMPNFSMTNVRRIEDYAFYGCEALFSIELPMRLTSIGRSAFSGCQQLKEIDLSGRLVSEIDDYAFFECINLQEVKLGNHIKTIGKAAFYNCSALKEAKLPNTVTSIGSHAYYRCSALTDLTIGDNLESIGDYAFFGCQALRKVDLGNNVKSVGNYAFYRCDSLLIVRLNDGLESIGDYAFYGAEKVTALTLPDSLKKVGQYAFKGWNGLTTLMIYDNLEEVGELAFYGMNNATIYTELSQAPNGWATSWNPSYRPVVWGCTLSDDAKYVVSVTMTEITLENAWAQGGFVEPICLGYTFAGWATTEGGEVVYTAAEIVNAPVGTTLYAVWVE